MGHTLRDDDRHICHRSRSSNISHPLARSTRSRLTRHSNGGRRRYTFWPSSTSFVLLPFQAGFPTWLEPFPPNFYAPPPSSAAFSYRSLTFSRPRGQFTSANVDVAVRTAVKSRSDRSPIRFDQCFVEDTDVISRSLTQKSVTGRAIGIYVSCARDASLAGTRHNLAQRRVNRAPLGAPAATADRE